jgi:hypothetical protein
MGKRFGRIKRKKRGQSPRLDNRTAKEIGRIHKKKKAKKEYHFKKLDPPLSPS